MKLSKAAKAARAKYMREWRAANKDKVALYNANHWNKRAREAKAAKEAVQ